MDPKELILGVQRRFLAEGDLPQGVFYSSELWDRLQGHLEERPRGEAEEDPSFKQLIPYGVLTQGPKVFVYQRLSKSGERRLRGLWSLGVGGHARKIPGKDLQDLIEENLFRELREELEISPWPKGKPTFRGFINDDGNAVGKVHVGLLYVWDIPESKVEVREKAKMAGEFMFLEECLRVDPELWESWSWWVLQELQTGMEAVKTV
ncbi:MAG: hypothetical protein KM310_06375 [Clostridiales bacterium]|nr:hypothetical protein [Clostridiales bacterium]